MLGIVSVLQVGFYVYKVAPKIVRFKPIFCGRHMSSVLQAKLRYDTRQRELRAYFKERAVKVKEVDCLKMFQGDKTELERAVALEHLPTNLSPDTYILKVASNCSNFRHHFGFIMESLTEVERHFPIAFSVLAFKSAAQVVQLLTAVYRPQNIYCLHLDKKSAPEFRHAMEAVSRCFPNVFLASRSINVRWGFYSVLEPEIVCMGDLGKNGTWKYFINLTGQEFPLRTNYELVRILSALGGANDISAGFPTLASTISRWRRFLPAPHNITLYKGAVHIVASRGFVDFVLHDPRAQDFLQWCKQTRHADEHFFNSLNRNPHLQAPGRYLGNRTEVDNFRTMSMSLSRYKNWFPRYPCPGHRVVHGICILNVLNLPLMYRRPELFANKFYADYSRLTLQCLAEALHNRTREQTLGRMGFNQLYSQQCQHQISTQQYQHQISTQQYQHQISTQQYQHQISTQQYQHQISTQQYQHQISTQQYQHQISTQQYQYQISTQQYQHQISTQQYQHQISTQQYLHQISTQQYQHQISTQQYQHQISTQQYQHQISTQQYQHQISTQQYQHQISTQQYQHQISTQQYQHQISTQQYQHQISTQQYQYQISTQQYQHQISTQQYQHQISTQQYQHQISTQQYQHQISTQQYQHQISTQQYQYQISTQQYQHQISTSEHILSRPSNF
ncbi:hypothetical protein ACOMHN_029428 [Nucella lapillus]